jgi:hypothetical protein
VIRAPWSVEEGKRVLLAGSKLSGEGVEEVRADSERLPKRAFAGGEG